ncbi:MAG: ABC transporter permease subunit [Candidatus Lokiarchaeota archaeon]|nr:ABC transporter permease subunit [Candidatus Lokiarchaeota archaeon]
MDRGILVKDFMQQIKRALAIAKKDIQNYYKRGPVIIFGFLTPLFLLMSFLIGRELEPSMLIPSLFGMTVFFSATSIGPAVFPWETRTKTLERVLSTPITLWAILLGDVFASFTFGIVFSIVPLIVGIVLNVSILHPLILIIVIVIGSFCFSSLSVLLSVPPTDQPHQIMMLSSLIRFPLLFISGVFVPLSQLSDFSRFVSYISPLTYFTDISRWITTGVSFLPVWVDVLVLCLFCVALLGLAIILHGKTIQKRL